MGLSVVRFAGPGRARLGLGRLPVRRTGWREFVPYAEPEGILRGWAILDPPVLMIYTVMLILVEPDKTKCFVFGHASEQILNLHILAGLGADARLGEQDRLLREGPDLIDGLAEHGREGVSGPVVVAVDADPGDVVRPRPPVADRTGAATVSVDGPKPGHVVGTLLP